MTSRRRRERDPNTHRRAHNILNSRDFLSPQYHKGRNLREGVVFITLAGPKATGKTTLSTELTRYIAARDNCRVLSTRASADAGEASREARRAAIRRQENGDSIRWYEIIEALNQEARSAYGGKVVPFLEESHDEDLKIVFLNRGLPDTLARQAIHAGVSLEAIAKELRGEPHKQPGYIKPDLTILTVVGGREAYQRVLYRGRTSEVESDPDDATELTVKLSPTFIDDIEKLNVAYRRVAGYDESGSYSPNDRVLPGRVVVYDTSTAIDYIKDREEVDREIKRSKEDLLKRILEEQINPLLEERLGNGRRRASR